MCTDVWGVSQKKAGPRKQYVQNIIVGSLSIVATARRAAPKPYLQKAKCRKHGEVARDSQVEQLSETSGSGSVRMLTRAGCNGYAAVRRAVSFLSEQHAVKLLKTVSLVATASAVAALLRLTR